MRKVLLASLPKLLGHGKTYQNCSDHREIEAEHFFMKSGWLVAAIVHLADHF